MIEYKCFRKVIYQQIRTDTGHFAVTCPKFCNKRNEQCRFNTNWFAQEEENMGSFYCDHCQKNCSLYEKEIEKPSFCPFSNEKVRWKKMSDQLKLMR